jgi:cytochrome c peroxidase
MKAFSRKRCFYGIVLAAIVLSFSVAGAAGLTPMEQLGKLMYQDKDFSFNGTQSCMTCHHHRSGFADPENSLDPAVSVVSTGADGVSQGGRNAPTAAYAGFSPILQWSGSDGERTYFGGMFWDGRATGLILDDPLAEQAQGPPLNPVEMAMPNKEAVVQVVRDAAYAPLFKKVFGRDALDFGNEDAAYDNIGRAIAAYERSPQVQKFSSRFDTGALTDRENVGFNLFNYKCTACHSATGSGAVPALFTNYGYANIGLPVNPLLTGNLPDLGLGGFLESDFDLGEKALIGDANYASQYGKFKVPTLRNVARTAPYGHNGVFATLREMVAFHNYRDSFDDPEVDENISDAVGSLGLGDNEIDDIVAFLKTLTDDLMMQP